MWRALIVLAACAHTSHTVPITIGPAHELIVPVVVNGEELMLQVDTGASTTSIAPATRARLKLPLVWGSARGAGAAGGMGSLDRAAFDTTTLAGVEIFRVLAVVLDLGGGSDGLLGMDVLHQVTCEIDLSNHRFSTYAKEDHSWLTAELVAVPYTPLAGGQIAIAVGMDGHAVTGILDLGANQSFANELALPARDESARLLTATVGADGHPWQFRAFGDVELLTGGIAFVAPRMLVADLPIFTELGLAKRPAVIIGADLLAGRRVVIDPVDHRVYFTASAKR